jgi:predicted phosphoribosyltransferase
LVTEEERTVGAGAVTRDLPELREKAGVFRDRRHAGEVLAGMLESAGDGGGIVFALPAGGVPVAVPVAETLGLALDVAVVSKVLLPWNTEAGYGAVAFDGTVRINTDLVRRLDLSRRTVAEGVDETRRKVERRMRLFRGDRPFPDLTGRSVIVVDDGLASGFTMLVALEAMRGKKAGRIVVAVPTGHPGAIDRICREADELYCANVRTGYPFAVAAAYRSWSDVTEAEVSASLSFLGNPEP